MLKWNDVMKLAREGNLKPDSRVEKSAAEWRAQLSEAQFQVAREGGTERAFSSAMCSLLEPGLYECLCCGTLLFNASEKFESGTGWPSFTQPVKANAVAYHLDEQHGMVRVETVCNACDAHLGHVFPDGPLPSGLRFCINSASIILAEKAKP